MAKLVGAHVYNNANQNVNDTTWTKLAFNSERFDTDTIHDNSTNNSRLTCNTAGKYLIIGNVTWDNNTTNSRYLSILLNNGTFLTNNHFSAAIANVDQSVSIIYDLAVNDYVELQVYQDSGGTRTVNYYDAYSPNFMMHRIG